MQLSQLLKEAHSEELSDAEKYHKMAESAPEKYAPILRDIAHEEELHAKHIKSILDDIGCDCEEDELETETATHESALEMTSEQSSAAKTSTNIDPMSK